MIGTMGRVRQKQTGGDDSTNYQIEMMVNNGLTYADAKDIFQTQLQLEIPSLTKIAEETADRRSIELFGAFISAIEKFGPEAFRALTDPGFQLAYRDGRLGYVRTGDPERKELLVSILAQRAVRDQHELYRAILDEAIRVAPKLASGQVAALTVLFVLENVRESCDDLDAVAEWLTTNLAPFASDLPEGEVWWYQLVYEGCLIKGPGRRYTIQNWVARKFAGLLSGGLDPEELNPLLKSYPTIRERLVECRKSPGRLQLDSLDHYELSDSASRDGWSQEQTDTAVHRILHGSLLPDHEVEQALQDAGWNGFGQLAEWWASTPMTELTPVGMVIAHENWSRVASDDLDLESFLQ